MDPVIANDAASLVDQLSYIAPALFIIQVAMVAFAIPAFLYRKMSRDKVGAFNIRQGTGLLLVSLAAVGVASTTKIVGNFDSGFNAFNTAFAGGVEPLSSGFLMGVEVAVWNFAVLGVIMSFLYLKAAGRSRRLRREERDSGTSFGKTMIASSVNRSGFVAVYGVGGRIEIPEADFDKIVAAGRPQIEVGEIKAFGGSEAKPMAADDAKPILPSSKPATDSGVSEAPFRFEPSISNIMKSDDRKEESPTDAEPDAEPKKADA